MTVRSTRIPTPKPGATPLVASPRPAILAAGASAAGALGPIESSWRAIVAFFRSEDHGALENELREAQKEQILSRTVVLVWISVFVMPSTIWSYVYFLARPHLGEAVAIVCLAIVVALVHMFLVRRGVYDRHYHLAMLLLVGGVFGPTGSAIVEVTRSSQGNFFFAFFLIYFAFTSLFPANLGWILATSAAITTSYVGARVFRPEGIVFDAILTSNVIYLAELTFIGAVLNRVLCKLFYDEKRSRVELAHANAELRELDKVKTNFFANISHEIRTPLTLILTPINHLLQTYRSKLDPDVVARLEGVGANGNRLLKMVNSLLDFAKLEAGQATVVLTDISIDDLIKYIASLFAATAENKGLRLVVEQTCGDAVLTSDLDKLEKILVNLLGNAMKFTPSGGTITLRSELRAETFVVRVMDTGPGVPREKHTAIFQRFTQLEGANQASVRGTGIGLSMVLEYAKLLGGEVSLESEVGKGSTFEVRLPQTRGSSERQRSASSAAPDSVPRPEREAGSELAVADLVGLEDSSVRGVRIIDTAGPDKPRILVVDDNPALVNLVASILQPDYRLFLANRGDEALTRMAQDQVDLVVSDVMMPGMSGLELCKRIRENPRTKHVPVILLTARGGSMQKVEGLDTGADDYIGKPFDPEELRARIRSLFELRRTTQGLAEKSRALEEALTKLKDEELKVIESEKLRTMGELAAGMFHELHNFMNVVCNGVQPLAEAVADLQKTLPPEQAEAVDLGELSELAGVIEQAALAARNVTGELKGFAHQDAVPKPTDVHAVLHSTLKMFGRRDAGLTVKLELHDGPLVVSCVPTRLTQVFTNVIKNAFEAMDGKGTVTIATSRQAQDVVVTVTDTGPGIPADRQVKLFEPFQTSKPQGKGLGLGLSLSRKVLHDLGGDLRHDASYTGGARFIATLPAAPGS